MELLNPVLQDTVRVILQRSYYVSPGEHSHSFVQSHQLHTDRAFTEATAIISLLVALLIVLRQKEVKSP